ncbi:MAG: HAD hydrolase family protein [Cyanobacteria bacterium]|nr:HAD hydrolase family protein [Cyanobacteriota bacterium]
MGKKQKELTQALETNPGDKITLIYATGRARNDVNDLVGLPEPAYSILNNGCTIVPGGPKSDVAEDAEWFAHLAASGFQKEKVKSAVESITANLGISRVRIRAEGTPYNCKVYLPQAELGEAQVKLPLFLKKMEETLSQEGIPFEAMAYTHLYSKEPTTVVHYIAKGGNKNHAIEFLMRRHQVPTQKLIVAGDDMIDIPMLKADGRKMIVVGNVAKVREHATSLPKEDIHIASPGEDSSLGVLAGLKKFLKLG